MIYGLCFIGGFVLGSLVGVISICIFRYREGEE